MSLPPPGRAAALALAMALGVHPSVSAQEPGPITVTGTVVDARSAEPVVGALVTLGGEGGPRGISDALGRFRIAGVSEGSHDLTARAFGYGLLEVDVAVTDPPAELFLRMEIDPVALEGLTVTGGARVSLGGTIVDATTGEPVPWAEITLTLDTQRTDARASADQQGVFSLPAVATADYFLRVERLGYEGQLAVVSVTAPPEPVEVRLRPDTALQRGLAEMNAQRRTRMNATPYSTRTIPEERLRYSRAPGMRHFLSNDAFMPIEPCTSGFGDECMVVRSRQVRPYVLIDEMPAMGLGHLDAYRPSDFYSLEVVLCGGGLPVIRAYTYRWVERTARRPQLLIDPCRLPPRPR